MMMLIIAAVLVAVPVMMSTGCDGCDDGGDGDSDNSAANVADAE
jgi:hypothetical protein